MRPSREDTRPATASSWIAALVRRPPWLPLGSCYVDSVCVIGLSEESTNRALQRVDAAFRQRGFRTHELECAVSDFGTVGVRLLGREREPLQPRGRR